MSAVVAAAGCARQWAARSRKYAARSWLAGAAGGSAERATSEKRSAGLGWRARSVEEGGEVIRRGQGSPDLLGRPRGLGQEGQAETLIGIVAVFDREAQEEERSSLGYRREKLQTAVSAEGPAGRGDWRGAVEERAARSAAPPRSRRAATSADGYESAGWRALADPARDTTSASGVGVLARRRKGPVFIVRRRKAENQPDPTSVSPGSSHPAPSWATESAALVAAIPRRARVAGRRGRRG